MISVLTLCRDHQQLALRPWPGVAKFLLESVSRRNWCEWKKSSPHEYTQKKYIADVFRVETFLYQYSIALTYGSYFAQFWSYLSRVIMQWRLLVGQSCSMLRYLSAELTVSHTLLRRFLISHVFARFIATLPVSAPRRKANNTNLQGNLYIEPCKTFKGS